MLVLRPVNGESGTALSHVRNRLLGYRDEENLPPAATAVQDVFRGIGEAARAVLGLRIALDGPQDESDDSPATARSREELDAEDAAIDAGEDDDRDEELTGLRRPTTRAAVQVAVGSSLAIVGGELLSSHRWYWAVLTCWIVFINTSSTGEILVKGYRRLLGTVFGVVAGIVLAGLVGQHTWTAFAVVLLCLFAMFYTAPLSYTLMSFFVTAALGVLYTLLHTYSFSVLVLRVEETALGAVCGIVAAAFVLPVRTDRRTNELLATVLELSLI
ncbi:FUSC family protein, partial [Streptomyces resistomycificus]|uniref:FUSC family protein n=1 Tax=Streptomyces resistomycificus TaxID=67356 RepID=UPI0004AAB706